MAEERARESETAALFEAGVIVGTRGLRGELRVRPHSGDGSALLDAAQVWLAVGKGEPAPLTVQRATSLKGQVLLQLDTLDHIDKVEGLIGRAVLLRYDELADLPEDSYYWHQLDGLRVVDLHHGEIGTLVDLFTTAAHDIYVVHGPAGEVLIPAVAAIVVAVDLDARCMRVDLPDGLLPGSDAV